MLNRPSSVDESACNVLLDEFPTIRETRKAIENLFSGKAPGADAIPVEICKAGGLPMAEKLTGFFQCI